MTPPATELQTLRLVARSLRARVDELDAVQLAWARLWRADEMHPWTAAALAVWDHRAEHAEGLPAHDTDGHDTEDAGWRLHHLAVLHHARAYDTENAPGADPAEALAHWETALGLWVRLHGCDPFWRALHRHVEAATGDPVPAAVVDAVRDDLPAHLLAVHTALADEHRAAAPETAAAHLRLVVRSGLPARDVAAARAGLVADLDNTVAVEVQRVRFGPVFDHVSGWLRIDPANPALLRNLLYVTDNWARYMNKQVTWTAQLAVLIDRTEQLLTAARAESGELPAGVAGEQARYEWWRGFWRLQTTPQEHTAETPAELRSRVRSLEIAAAHLRRAVELDPLLPLQSYYEVRRWLARALLGQAVLRDLLGLDPAAVEHDLSAALEHDPTLAAAHELRARRRGREVTRESFRRLVLAGAVRAALEQFQILAAADLSAADRLGISDDARALGALVESDPRLRARFDAAWQVMHEKGER